jgi:tryptophanyl-tRNA synthetase
MRKVCIYCGKRKNKGSFSKHIHHKDNLDTRCKKCVKRHTKVRNKLRKKAPQKPEICECCKITKKLCLDHDHKDNSFRGWICSPCNEGIGKLGDNLEGVVNAMNYFLSRPKKN